MKETFRTATTFLIATLSLTLSTFAFGTTSPLSLGDTASVHLNPDGGYIAYCKNGEIEHITDMDLKLDNMCPRLEKIDSLGILSIQMREDGNFDVLCQDLSKATVSREEILSGKVCPRQQAALLEDGTYKKIEGSPRYYDQKLQVTYANGVLTRVYIYLRPNSSWSCDLQCKNNICKGKGSNSDSIIVEVIGKNKYRFEENGKKWGIFEKR